MVLNSEWQPIETAPKDGTQVILAHIRNGAVYWVALAEWGSALPGTVQCASFSGWFAELPMMTDPARNPLRETRPAEPIIGHRNFPPTHWMPLPPAPAQRTGE